MKMFMLLINALIIDYFRALPQLSSQSKYFFLQLDIEEMSFLNVARCAMCDGGWAQRCAMCDGGWVKRCSMCDGRCIVTSKNEDVYVTD